MLPMMDEIDAQGQTVRRGFVLGMRDVLPAGHQWVTHVAPVPTQAELITGVMAQARVQRLPIMNILDGMQTSAVVTADTALAAAIETCKQGLRNITAIDLTPYATEADMKQAIYAAYLAIAAAAPASVQSAFQSLVP